jgi:tetratricopeptide (TPR) repeat protein
MADRWYGPDVLSQVAAERLDFVSALEYARLSLQAGDDYVRFNPANNLGWHLWANSYDQTAVCLFQLGRVQESIDQLHAGTELAHDPRNSTGTAGSLYYCWANLARWEAMRGNREAAQKAVKAAKQDSEAVMKQMQLSPEFARLSGIFAVELETRVRMLRKDFAGTYATTTEVLAGSKDWPSGPTWQLMREDAARPLRALAVESALQLGKISEAEAVARTLLETQVEESKHGDRKDDIARAQVLLAQAVALQGRGTEARTILDPALAYYRGKQRPDGSGSVFTVKFARALYVQSLTEADDAAGRAKAQAALAEATAQLEDLSGEIKELVTTRMLTGWISAELTKLGH